LLIEH
jgi:hypothetical protein